MALLHEINNGTQRFSVDDGGAIKFNNAFTFPTADGTANYILKTNGSGTVSWSPDNYENYDYWVLQGDSATNVNINSTNILKFIGGTYIDTSATWAGGSNPRKLTINHETTSRTDTTSTDAPAFGGTFEAVTSVSTNSTGHVTGIDVSTITIPTDPGGTVKGTGTATRVAFWSASDTITSDADLYWDNTNKRLGIGKSPSAKLEVSGDTGGGDSIVRFQNTNSTAKNTRIQLLDSAGTVGDALIAYDHSNASALLHYLGMGVNNSTTLVINNSDKVGIGTVLPGEYGPATGTVKLDVKSGDIIRSGFTDPANSWIGFTALPGYNANQYPSVTSKSSLHFANNDKYCAFLEGTDTYFGMLNSALNTKVFFATGSQNSYLGGSGNFGVGVTGPLAKLHVVGGTVMTGGWGRSIFLEDTYPAIVYGGNATKYAACAYDHSTDVMRWYTGAATSDATQGANLRMSLQAGKLGIGVDSPQRPLHVNGTEGVARFTSTASGNSGFEVGIGTASQAFLWQTENSYMHFATNSVERMRIASSGQIVFTTTGQPPITNALYGNIVLDSNAVTNYQRIRFDVGTTAYWGLTRLTTGNFAITGGSTWNDHALEIDWNEQNVGINTSPELSSKLHIKETGSAHCKVTIQSLNNNDTLINYSTGSNEMSAGFNSSNFKFVIVSGQDLESSVLFAILQSNGNTTIAGSLTQNSDITLKENIKPLESQLDIVSKLNPVSYNKIGQEENEVGFIAQEVEKLLPELVSEDEKGIKSLAYGNMNAILVKAIQELKAEIEILKNK